MKVIQIGFNKCGTTSLDVFFKSAGFNSIHWGAGKLAATIEKNYKDNKPLLNGYEKFNCFSDMELVTSKKYIYAFMDYYQFIDKQYDDVYFILNTRDVNRWIDSRLKHNNGTYLERFCSILNMNKKGVINYWLSMWYKHHAEVLTYFYNRENFLLFNIDTGNGDMLCEFLNIDKKFAKKFGHFHKSK